MFVQSHHSLEELQRLTKALTKKRIWLRHQAVVLAKQGHSAPAIARALGCSHRAVQAWVGRYNQGGLAALQERPHTGRPPRLAAADVPRFRDRLEAGPTPEDGVCTFRCQDLRRILEEEFGVSLRRQAIYDLLHRLDYSSLMPRPQHEQATPRSRNSSRRSSSSRSTPSPRRIPRRRFIPISRMKPAAARRGRSHGSGRGGVRDRVRCGRRDSPRSTCWRPSAPPRGRCWR